MAGKLVAAVYLVDRAYGGPEEGGWWYTYGELVRVIRTFPASLEHHVDRPIGRWLERYQQRLDATLNRGRRPISSVRSTGRYYVELHDDAAPASYPLVRPHYE